MPTHEAYERQVQLLVRILPVVAEEEVFALKGGTAINLFVRDLPRLSVDIDLTYLPIEDWATSVARIEAALTRIAGRIRERIPNAQVNLARNAEGQVVKAHVQAGAPVKIEVTPVSRGVVFDPATGTVTPAVEDRFGFVEAPVVSHADLYAGKLVAALDRQHPRDLFDAGLLLDAEGIDDDLRVAFIAYLLSSPRPMHRILNAPTRPLQPRYEQEFVGMTSLPTSLELLEQIRERTIQVMVREMPADHRHFLMSFKTGAPDWSLLSAPTIADLPAVRGRQARLDALPHDARAVQVQLLAEALGKPGAP